MPPAELRIRAAQSDDAGTIYGFVRELAEYEKLAHMVEASEADLRAHLFGPAPKLFGTIAEWHGSPVGFAVWFYNYSTFRGRHGIWVEDLYVRASHRGRGIGKALLADLAARCTREGCARLEWSVLDWNEPSIRFYRSIGAVGMDEWRIQRLSGEALAALAATG